MCWFCDHPGGTRADYVDQLRRTIAGHGWAVQGIQRDGFHPPWAYTVGLSAFGRPELVATGLTGRRAMRLLNHVAEHLLRDPALKPEEPAGGWVIQLLEVAEPAAHLEMAVELFGRGIRALQVVHADDLGHWPWECGYRGLQGGQPIFRASQPAALPPGVATAPYGSAPPADQRRPGRGPGIRRAVHRRRPRYARSSSRPPSRLR